MVPLFRRDFNFFGRIDQAKIRGKYLAPPSLLLENAALGMIIVVGLTAVAVDVNGDRLGR